MMANNFYRKRDEITIKSKRYISIVFISEEKSVFQGIFALEGCIFEKLGYT